MNILCKLLGHVPEKSKGDWNFWNYTCRRKGCSYVHNSPRPKAPPMPECKPPRYTPIEERLDVALQDFQRIFQDFIFRKTTEPEEKKEPVINWKRNYDFTVQELRDLNYKGFEYDHRNYLKQRK